MSTDVDYDEESVSADGGDGGDVSDEDANGDHQRMKTMLVKDDPDDADEDADADADEREADEEEAQQLATPSEQQSKAEQEEEEADASDGDERIKAALEAMEDDLGYPRIHDAFKRYTAHKEETCTNPTHLILFAKKTGLVGVTFAAANKYFKARKNANASRSPARKQSRPKPRASIGRRDDGFSSSDSDESGHSAHEHGKDELPDAAAPAPTVESPIVVTQSNEQEAVAGAQLNLDVADEEKEVEPQEDEAELASSPRLTPEPVPTADKSGSGGSPRKKKKKRKLMVAAAEQMGRLKKVTNYTRFAAPLYILPLGVAEAKNQGRAAAD